MTSVVDAAYSPIPNNADADTHTHRHTQTHTHTQMYMNTDALFST